MGIQRDITKQNFSISKNDSLTIYAALYVQGEVDPSVVWIPHTSSTNWQAVCVVTDKDGTPLVAIKTSNLSAGNLAALPTAVQDVIETDNFITFQSTTRDNPLTDTSQTVIEAVCPFTSAQMGYSDQQLKWGLRVYGEGASQGTTCTGSIFVGDVVTA